MDDLSAFLLTVADITALAAGIKPTVMLDYYVPRAKGRGKRGGFGSGGEPSGEVCDDGFLLALNDLCCQVRPHWQRTRCQNRMKLLASC